jgi:hypothetical protein
MVEAAEELEDKLARLGRTFCPPKPRQVAWLEKFGPVVPVPAELAHFSQVIIGAMVAVMTTDTSVPYAVALVAAYERHRGTLGRPRRRGPRHVDAAEDTLLVVLSFVAFEATLPQAFLDRIDELRASLGT